MSRINSPDSIKVKPTTNVYTVLVVVATAVAIIGLVMIWSRAATLFEGGLLGK
jgi:hypothetical protein